ncbi:hypothetical protein Avbf_00325 [Armadillidium vulgare]|nr:hypothetical protein Avbf_00325 [Armadillidium vulgare]
MLSAKFVQLPDDWEGPQCEKSKKEKDCTFNLAAICDPECINGGICLAPNICECSSEFRGPICQYPISNCDPKKLNFNGGYNCSGENMDFGCQTLVSRGS